MTTTDTPNARAILTLARALSHSHLQAAWKATVRDGLRRQPVQDLHDHLDTHWRLSQIVARARAEAVTFRYRPKEPEIIRLEKSRGIARRTVVPAAVDAIVMQALVDSIAPSVLRAQPTKTAFFARSRARPRTLADVDDTFPSDWLGLWKEGQRRIWEFTQTHHYIVVTDIANYFDAIPLSQLRNRISSLGHFAAPVLDILFYSLESLTWRPEYLPRSNTGLPQIQSEAPRLLAHAYLYEVDRYLRRACRNDVVRWMDDISFGVDNVEAGKRILRDLDELLSSLGVRLNTGKTQILPAKQGVHYFRMRENRYLSTVENAINLRPLSAKTQQRAKRYVRSLYRRFTAGDRLGYWEKIVKRFFTIFGRLGDPYMQRHVPELLRSNPALRDSAYRYYQRLGYTRTRFDHIRAFVLSEHCLDDSAVFGAARLLVEWTLPRRGTAQSEAVGVAFQLAASTTNPAIRTCAAIWILAKYGTPSDLDRAIWLTERHWRTSEWAARQVAAVVPRLDPVAANRVTAIMAAFGLTEGSAVLTHLNEIRGKTAMSRAERRYLVHPSTPFPLPKVLTGIAFLGGALSAQDKTQLRADLLRVVSDWKYAHLVAAA